MLFLSVFRRAVSRANPYPRDRDSCPRKNAFTGCGGGFEDQVYPSSRKTDEERRFLAVSGALFRVGSRKNQARIVLAWLRVLARRIVRDRAA
jgi:hypothetical protein